MQRTCPRICALALVIAAIAAIAVPAVAQEPVTGTRIPRPQAVELPENLYAAPTTIDRIGRIMAPVMVNGQGPFRFILDTGASHSAVSPGLAQKLGLVPDEASPIKVQGVTGTEEVPSVRVESLQAGDFLLRDFAMPVVSAHVFANAQGILGVGEFHDMRITVDFEKNRILISRERISRRPSGWYRVETRLRFGRLMIGDARIGNVRVKAVIDTGAERSLGNLALRAALGLDLAAQKSDTRSQVLGATGGEFPANSILSPRIRLGQADIRSLEVTFADLNVFRIWELEDQPALVIGMDVLGTVRKLIFDYKRAELLILP